jgi:hypothetical protein
MLNGEFWKSRLVQKRRNSRTLAEIEMLLPDAQQQRQNKKRVARLLDCF